MSIDFDQFLSWAESRFDDVVVRGNEILLNSIFCDDSKHHLWCNPYGGKTNCENGVYHCWKSDKSGSLVGLVMEVDKCSYAEAIETLGISVEGDLFDLEKRVQEIFDKKDKRVEEIKNPPTKTLDLPEDCYRFEDLPSYNKISSAGIEYLRSRQIDERSLLVCTKGRYRNRIIIPYHDSTGNLIYYNGRYIGDPGQNLRYLGPPKELGVGKGDVLFVPDWPPAGKKIYIAEGEFDAISLRQSGFYSAALGGKNMTQRQMEMISPYIPVLCLDADDHGGDATMKIASNLLSFGFKKVSYVRPCVEYKDWNGLFVAKGGEIVSSYINLQEKDYDMSMGEWESMRLKMKGIIR